MVLTVVKGNDVVARLTNFQSLQLLRAFSRAARVRISVTLGPAILVLQLEALPAAPVPSGPGEYMISHVACAPRPLQVGISRQFSTEIPQMPQA